MKLSGTAVISLSKAVRIDSVSGGCGGLEHTQYPFSNIRRNRLQSSDEVSQKSCGVVIPFIQRQPGDRSLATGDPFADQRGFAKAGGGGDKVSLRCRPSFSRSIRRGRRTTLGRGGGMKSLVAKIGVDIESIVNTPPKFIERPCDWETLDSASR